MMKLTGIKFTERERQSEGDAVTPVMRVTSLIPNNSSYRRSWVYNEETRRCAIVVNSDHLDTSLYLYYTRVSYSLADAATAAIRKNSEEQITWPGLPLGLVIPPERSLPSCGQISMPV